MSDRGVKANATVRVNNERRTVICIAMRKSKVEGVEAILSPGGAVLVFEL